jgi:putative effector of murein hydrolase LrgA (UPF0299 family)
MGGVIDGIGAACLPHLVCVQASGTTHCRLLLLLLLPAGVSSVQQYRRNTLGWAALAWHMVLGGCLLVPLPGGATGHHSTLSMRHTDLDSR